MSRRRLWLGGALAVAVVILLVVWPRAPSPHPETTWDTAPRGHAGLFALLERFGGTRGRWLTGLSMPPVDEVLWLIAPVGFCDAAPDAGSGFRDLLLPWLEAGGQALVWLPRPPRPSGSEDAVPWPAPAEGEVRTIDRRVADGDAHPAADADGSSEASDGRAGEHSDAAPGEGEAAPEEGSGGMREQWREDLEAARRALREGRAERCGAIGDFRLPSRARLGHELASPAAPTPEAEGLAPVHPVVRVGEDATEATTRFLPGSSLAFFEKGAAIARTGWRPLWVGLEHRAPFALERTVGAGRLGVVADARVLTNARLDRADAAPFVFDWIRTTGPVWIDEHVHGVVPESGTLRYLLRSPAWAAMVGLLGLGLLVAWRGWAWPVRRVEEAHPESPTLSAFVDSVARLYARSRDFDRIFERYRALSLERIRRALGLAPGTPAEIVVASLRAREAGGSALRETGLGDLLTRQVRVASVEELERATARLDALVDAIRLASGPSGRDRPGTTRSAA